MTMKISKERPDESLNFRGNEEQSRSIFANSYTFEKKDVHVPIASKNEVDYLTYFLRELFRLLVILYS